MDALLPAFEGNDQVTAVMACATGKTLVALWAMERWLRKLSRPGRVLVLLPSPALLQQILHGWLKETRLEDLSYLCVCSDPTVTTGTDEIVVRQSETDFKVSTDPEEFRRFLANKSEGPKIVFSTYQSVDVVQRGARIRFGISACEPPEIYHQGCEMRPAGPCDTAGLESFRGAFSSAGARQPYHAV